ncbi:MAG: phospholipase D-like domain-containing protein [Gammaproteobacteria bacterium]|jgi:phosphatidylserine/phosphatidylglycerophosphate/cardiolipin synthase-like enzyme|nr:phospholipase D-like domain-containing protein [Gammaproteobacteria bacterium]
MTLYIEPHAGVGPVIAFIQQARGTLDINAYLATDRRVIQAIAQDVRRGIRVRVLIDRRPYGGRPHGEIARLRATGAQVRYAPARFTRHSAGNAQRYVFDHAKYMVSGSSFELGTANLTWSALGGRNREYLDIARQPTVAHALQGVFTADWHNRPAGNAPRQTLVLSPAATPALVAAIRQPGAVCIESEELGKDRAILNALRAKSTQAQVLLPVTLNRYDRRIAQGLITTGVRVRYLVAPYLHAKLIAGPREAFLGFENFTWTSLNRNREVGIILGNPAAARLDRQCTRDWSAAR